MKSTRSRRGSALLIVLGMLAFIVVSAVAFAAYMRASRLPSSYLRRTAAARMLAKAAVVQAIEQIDTAIANNPYPDQRTGTQLPSQKRVENLNETGGECRNYWWHNIFIGDDTWMHPEDTVSTLTLEGLAYIPPPLVNEARRYSRMSKAATWHTMGFDSGRYAFCAIDVSDCLDINRLVADGRRNSGARRITLAHLFENDTHTSYAQQPSGWETFMSDYRAKLTDDQESSQPRFTQAKLPLVSLADWNLAVHAAKSAGGVESPFCKFIEGTGTEFYKGVGLHTGAEAVRAMHFVTDSYFPPVELQSDECDLCSYEGQPFDTFVDYPTLRQILAMGETGSRGMQLINKKVSKMDLINLYDYLDGNDVPVSLAVPTTERVPMICAVKPDLKNLLSFKLSPDSLNPVDSPIIQGNTITHVYEYKLQFTPPNAGAIETWAAFPFRRDEASNDNFTYEGSLRLFLAPAGIGFRLPQSALRPADKDDWQKDRKYENGVFKVKLAEQKLEFSNIQKEEDAVKKLNFPVQPGSLASVFSDPVFRVKVSYPYDPKTKVTDLTQPTYLEAHCSYPPLTIDGEINDAYANDAKFLQMVKNGGGEQLTLYAAVYIRVKNSEGKTVDMVPASYDDDRLNDVDNRTLGPVAAQICGEAVPILRFTGAQQILYSPEGLKTLSGDPQTIIPSCVMCPDPRFNHAPENWMEKNVASEDDWIRECGAADRDGDIFMFVSNQEYLQSIYELSFLPNFSELNRSGDTVQGNCARPARNNTAYPQNIAECANGNLMWNTYRCYPNQNGNRHDFEGIGLVVNDGAFRINPFAQSVDALMPAFANTPYDWWAASTNNPDITEKVCDSAEKFNKVEGYAFNQMNNKDKFAWEDLRNIAEYFRDKVRESGGDWEDAFDKLKWDGDIDHFGSETELSSDTDELYGVDRKFLYGFWHDSFANRQQLFLVFVRAEPMMMGGGGVGQTPPSLGARAVALVWRDPAAPEPQGGNSLDTPHRTRILFYRQFD